MTPQPPFPPARAADPVGEEALVRESLPLVGYLVSEVLTRVPGHVSRDELTSAGLAALAQAARGYDPSRGVPFARFASTRIRGALVDELRGLDWASRSVRSKVRQRHTVEEQLAATLGRTPTDAEVATQLGVRVADLDAVETDVARAVVLSLQGFGDAAAEEVAPVGDPGAEEHLLGYERIGYLHDAITVLPERLRTVVLGYFFEERPMLEIAEALGVTESRVSQMRGEALALLRAALQAHLDPERPAAGPAAAGCAARRREAYVASVAAHSDYKARLSARPVDLTPAVARSA